MPALHVADTFLHRSITHFPDFRRRNNVTHWPNPKLAGGSGQVDSLSDVFKVNNEVATDLLLFPGLRFQQNCALTPIARTTAKPTPTTSLRSKHKLTKCNDYDQEEKQTWFTDKDVRAALSLTKEVVLI